MERLLYTVMNVNIHVNIRNHKKKLRTMKAIIISAINVRKLSRQKMHLDGHFDETHRRSTQENYKNVCIVTDSTVCDKFLEEKGWV